jgi:predicted TIM-barrel enzyme
VRDVKSYAGDVPVFVGSGITAATVAQYAPYADGFIVGTAFKRDGDPANPVEPARVKELRRALG